MVGFWKDKNVLVTGSEGFLGSNLTLKLLPHAACLVGLDIRIKRKKTLLSDADYKKITVIKGSVADFKLLKNTLKRYKINTVFHLAAEAIVANAFKKPLKTFDSNIKGTWNVLEASRLSPEVKAVVIASSDKAYGSHKKLPYKENLALCGNHPYDVSKSCADLLASAYHHTFGLPVAITRCGNIYGPGDFNFSRIVPDAIRSAVLDKPLLIRSDGRFTRDYVYVDDIVNGYILIAQKLSEKNLTGEALNFSNESPVTVIELVMEIYKILGKATRYKILNRAECEIKHQYLSSQKARRALGWKPEYSLADGLKKTIGWYKKILA